MTQVLAATATPEAAAANWQWWVTAVVSLGLLVGLFAFNSLAQAGNIARATAKESIRQPVFALLLVISLLLILVNTFLPFFSMGEDVKMLKDCGLATILISGLLLAVWSASTSIASEIEGKTAMTLLSKPINRRQFIIGKYLGILQAVVLMLLPMFVMFLLAVYYKVGYDARESAAEAPSHAEKMAEVIQITPGLLLILLEICIMSAVSVVISTRLPMIVNMVSCFTIFVVGHLTPVLVQQGALQLEFVSFVARLIAAFLPSLEVFNMKAAVATGVIVPPAYLASALLYCTVYCAASILVAFILFEDRDLA